MTTRRIRFSVASLLVVTTALVLFLGYSQWRRRTILRQVEEIRQLGGQVEVSRSYVDYVWQRRPTKGHITVYSGKSATKAAREGEKQVELEERMEALGVTEISKMGEMTELK